MAGARLGAALRHIQRLFTEGSATGVSDTQLLGRFAAHRDEAAFAALLARHGPMVMTVCRGVQILAWMVLTDEGRELTAQDFFGDSHAVAYNMFTSEPLLPTNPAAFNFGLLIPGVRYYVGSSGTYHPISVMKPGEVRDLGKITIKDPQEAD